MGTRAQFFVGNPENIHRREWLGCFGMDGYPDAEDIMPLAEVKSEEEFRTFVERLIKARRGRIGGEFPFPWTKNLFLTDCTYVWLPQQAPEDADIPGGRVMLTRFHSGWIEMSVYLSSEDEQERYNRNEDVLPDNVPAPGYEAT